ncbi:MULTISPECIES: hypothetical protein [unclassified Pseudomonas]|uniref:hypothetical protein n=1 Tax=unclassified Pseudomonas TaxID=196821 RepID=UPI001179D0BB|nr:MULTISPECIES: hypothetical protein [unclassified Pseudomonas]
MPNYIPLPTPNAYYYTTSPNNNTQVHQSIGFNRNDPNNVAYTLYGLTMATHIKDSGFNILTDVYTSFQKGDILSVEAVNLSKGPNAYKSSFQLPIAYAGPARFYFTTAEMLKLGIGNIRITCDIYSALLDTYWVPNSYSVTFVSP